MPVTDNIDMAPQPLDLYPFLILLVENHLEVAQILSIITARPSLCRCRHEVSNSLVNGDISKHDRAFQIKVRFIYVS